MATERLQVYKCSVCGNIVEVIHAARGTLVCCGQDMNLLKEGETDAATEKHVPVIEKIDGGYKVKVGDFMIDADGVTAREYCNLHGLWKA